MKIQLSHVLIVVLLTLTSASWAKGSFLTAVTANYNISPTSVIGKAKCQLCHNPGGYAVRNKFGDDFGRLVTTVDNGKVTPDVFKQLDMLDSDGDGYTNGEEFKADSLPGDPTSTPSKALTVTVMPPLTKADDISTALAAAPWQTLGIAPLAQVRLGVAGSNLALEAKVAATWITPDMKTWDVTTLEVAAAPSLTASDLSILGITPKGPNIGDVALTLKGVAQPTPTIMWTSMAMKGGGYDLCALIPLTTLGADPAAKTLTFEIAALVSATPGTKPDFASLFRSPDGFKDARLFGTLTIQPAPLPKP